MKYLIKIEARLSDIIEIHAESEDKAHEIATAWRDNVEFDLNEFAVDSFATKTVEAKADGVGRDEVIAMILGKQFTRGMLDDIMTGAFEGGITHWVESAEGGKPEANDIWYAHPGFALTLHTVDGERFELNQTNMIEAVQKNLERNARWNKRQATLDDIDLWDAADYDETIQIAIFGEVYYS